MNIRLRASFFFLVVTALAFGFFHHIVPQGAKPDFLRLHIFWFNLLSGGSIILYRALGRFTRVHLAFFCVSLLFSLFAAYDLYLGSIACALVLSGLMESVRIRRFSLFPLNFFTRAPVSEKFMQASLLCLSIGLALSALAMANEGFGHWFSSEKFNLNTFFLGFSFPVSLVTLSLIMEGMQKPSPLQRILQNAVFWVLNLGVITFFLFILAGAKAMEIAVSCLLTAGIFCALHLHRKLCPPGQRKALLSSGVFFLLATAASGIIYIVYEFFPESGFPDEFAMRFHAYVSLFGWNLSGLITIIRIKDFPLLLSRAWLISCHWAAVALLCPLGFLFPSSAPAAVALFALFLGAALFVPAQNPGGLAAPEKI